MQLTGRTEYRYKLEINTNDTECCECCVVFTGDDVETDVEEQSGGVSSLTVRVLCLPQTMSEILLSKTSTEAGTFCQQKHIIMYLRILLEKM